MRSAHNGPLLTGQLSQTHQGFPSRSRLINQKNARDLGPATGPPFKGIALLVPQNFQPPLNAISGGVTHHAGFLSSHISLSFFF